MGMTVLLRVFVLLSTMLVAASSIDLPMPLPINLLRPKTSSSGYPVAGLSCESWRFAVETNNLRNWNSIPTSCVSKVSNYILGRRYREDCRIVVEEAIKYASNVTLGTDGKDIWIFDIDETTLSNIPYYVENGFGATPYNATRYNEWVETGEAPALPESLRLYNYLLALGIKPVFLTGRSESFRAITASNLEKAGYAGWEMLLFKGTNVHGTAAAFKSGVRKKLVETGGYRIIGNIGDQWSDILGDPEGDRTFKLPDPMYYVA